MDEKKGEKKMAVACPLCLKRGKQSKVRLFQINYSEALVSCEDAQCPFPLLEGHLTNIVRRDIITMKDEVPAKDSAPDNSVCGHANSSQEESASIKEPEDKSNSDQSATLSANNATVTSTITTKDSTASNSEEIYNKFEFQAPIPAQKEAKKKPRKKYYTGRKKKCNKKPSPKSQIPDVGVEPES